MSKAQKADVDYSQGMSTRRCSLCVYFEREKPHSCTKVVGEILPHMWCIKFKRGGRDHGLRKSQAA